MRRIFRLFPIWLWVIAGILSLGFINTLLAPRTAQAPTAITPKKPQKSLTDAFEEFEAQIKESDPNGLSIADVEQFQGSNLLYFVAGPDYLRSDNIARGELILSLRDLWAKTCECDPVLVFKTEGGVELAKANPVGKPVHIN